MLVISPRRFGLCAGTADITPGCLEDVAKVTAPPPADFSHGQHLRFFKSHRDKFILLFSGKKGFSECSGE
jgi:hypothetical protein